MSRLGDRCQHTVKGPKVGHHVVLWSRQCLRTSGKGSRYCWQHAPEHAHDKRRWSS